MSAAASSPPQHAPPDEAAFAALVAEHQAMVFRTLYRLLGGAQDLDDLAQEVFLRLYRGLRGFRGEAKLETYLYRITVNVANDALRRQGVARRRDVSLSDEDAGLENRLASTGPGADEMLREREFARALDAAMGELKAAERAVLVLYHQEEQSYEAIAAALGMPVNTVRTHLHRGRARLRGLLAAHAGEGMR